MYKKIDLLKKQNNTAILAHYYVPEEIKDVADVVGDSYALSKEAVTFNASSLVFCGVHFMGESAKLLNPEKRVYMPDPSADCPMAHMVDLREVARIRKEIEDLAVVCYINSTTEVKAASDVIVTSANAEKILKALVEKNILFIPDKNLGAYLQKKVPEKNIITLDGYCYVHNNFRSYDFEELKKKFPGAPVLAHPESNPEILALADFVGSTSAILKKAKTYPIQDLIIATEEGLAYNLQKDNPDKFFHFPEHRPICQDMKKNNLEGIVRCLEEGTGEIEVDPIHADKARKALRKMLELAQ